MIFIRKEGCGVKLEGHVWLMVRKSGSGRNQKQPMCEYLTNVDGYSITLSTSKDLV